MHGKLRGGFFRRVYYAAVRDDCRVNTYGIQIFKVVRKRTQIGVACKHVGGYVHLFIKAVGKVYRIFQLFAIKVIRKRAQRKRLTAYVRRVRTEIKSRFKFGKVACRGKKFYFHMFYLFLF